MHGWAHLWDFNESKVLNPLNISGDEVKADAVQDEAFQTKPKAAWTECNFPQQRKTNKISRFQNDKPRLRPFN